MAVAVGTMKLLTLSIAIMQVVLFVTVMLVNLSVAVMQVTLFVAIVVKSF